MPSRLFVPQLWFVFENPKGKESTLLSFRSSGEVPLDHPVLGQLPLLGLPACSSVVLSGARRASAPWILWMAQLLAEMELICL